MQKRIFKTILLSLFVFVALFLTSCTEKTYSVELPEGATINLTDNENIKKGTSLEVTFEVPFGKEIDYVLVNETKVSHQANKVTVIVEENISIKVFYKDLDDELPIEKYFSLTLPDEVTSNIDNEEEILENKEVVLTVNVPENKVVDELKVNGVVVTLTNNKYTFNIKKDTVVTITFKEVIKYVSLDLKSGITTTLENVEEVLIGSEVTIKINVPVGKALVKVLINELEFTPEDENYVNGTYTFTITEDTVVSAIFKELEEGNYYILSFPEYMNANINDPNNVKEDTLVTLTVLEVENKILDKVFVNGTEVEVVDNKFTIKMTENITVTATFIDAYKVTLPMFVTTEEDNLEKVAKGSVIELTIDFPSHYLFYEFKVNGEVILLTSNKYEVEINDHTIIELILFSEARSVDVLYFLENMDKTLIKKGFIQAVLEGNSEEESSLIELVLKIDEFLNINELYLNIISDDYYHTYTNKFYLDGQYFYSIMKDYEKETDEEDSYKNAIYFDSRTETLEMILLALLLEQKIPNLPTGPITLNNAIETLLTLGLKEIEENLEGELKDVFKFYKKDDLFKIIVNIDLNIIEKLFNIIPELNLDFEDVFEEVEDFQIELQILFENYSLKTINIEGYNQLIFEKLEFSFELSYVEDLEINSDEFLDIDVSDLEKITLNFVYDENKTVEAFFDKELIKDFYGNLTYLLSPYKEGYYAVGFYQDEDFTIEFTDEDFVDGAYIYIEWMDFNRFNVFTSYYNQLDHFVFRSREDELIYIEDEDYIYIFKEYFNYLIDKEEELVYSVFLEGETSAILISSEEISYLELKNIIKDESNYDLSYNGAYLNIKDKIVLIDGFFLLLSKENSVLETGMYIPYYNLDEEELTTMKESLLKGLNNIINDQIINIDFNRKYKMLDIEEFDEAELFYLVYLSGKREKATVSKIKELLDIEIYYELIDGQYGLFSLIEGLEYQLDDAVLYDSNRGLAIILEGIVYYQEELEEFPKTENSDYMTVESLFISGGYVHTIEQLKNISTTKPYLRGYANEVLNDFADFIENAKNKGYLNLEGSDYNIYVDVEELKFIIEEGERTHLIQFGNNDVTYHIDNIKVSIPIEKFNYISFQNDVIQHYSGSYALKEDFKFIYSLYLAISQLEETYSGHHSYQLVNNFHLYYEGSDYGLTTHTNFQRFYITIKEGQINYTLNNDFEYEVTLKSKDFEDVLISLENIYELREYRFYEFYKYNFQGIYPYVDGEVSFKRRVNDSDYDLEVKEYTFYLNYEKTEEIDYYLNKFLTNQMYTIKFNDYYYLKFYKDNVVEYYYKEGEEEILVYVNDLVNNKTYTYNNGYYYEINYLTSFNFDTFLSNISNEDFEYELLNNMYVYKPEEMIYENFYSFLYYPKSNSVHLVFDNFHGESHNFRFILEDFMPKDLNDLEIEEDYIKGFYRDDYGFLTFEEYEAYYNVAFEFASGRIERIELRKLKEEYGYEVFKSKYDVILKGTFLGYDYEYSLSETGSKVIDPKYGKYVYFYELNRGYYLDDLANLESLPILENHNEYDIFVGWRFEYEYELLTIEKIISYMNDSYNDYQYLVPVYE